MIAHRVLGVSLLETGAARAAKGAFEDGLSLYDPAEHGSLKFRYGQDPRSAALSFLAVVLFELGCPDPAHAATDAAVSHANSSTTPTR